MIGRCLWILIIYLLLKADLSDAQLIPAPDGVVAPQANFDPWPPPGMIRLIDDQGSIVPGAKIEIENVRLKSVISETSNSKGEFQFPEHSEELSLLTRITKDGYEPLVRQLPTGLSYTVVIKRKPDNSNKFPPAPLFNYWVEIESLNGPVAGAKIEYRLAPHNYGRQVVTDDAGIASLRDPYAFPLEARVAMLKITKEGFEPTEMTVSLSLSRKNTVKLMLARSGMKLCRITVRHFETGAQLNEKVNSIDRYCVSREGNELRPAGTFKRRPENSFFDVEIPVPTAARITPRCVLRASQDDPALLPDDLWEQDVLKSKTAIGEHLFVYSVTLSPRSDRTGVNGYVFVKDRRNLAAVQRASIVLWRKRFDGRLITETESLSGSNAFNNYQLTIKKAGNYRVLFLRPGFKEFHEDFSVQPMVNATPQISEWKRLNVALAYITSADVSVAVPDLEEYFK